MIPLVGLGPGPPTPPKFLGPWTCPALSLGQSILSLKGKVQPGCHCPDEKKRHKSIDPMRMEAEYRFVHTLLSAQGRPFSHLGKAPIQSLPSQLPPPEKSPLLSAGSLPLSLADDTPKHPLCCRTEPFMSEPEGCVEVLQGVEAEDGLSGDWQHCQGKKHVGRCFGTLENKVVTRETGKTLCQMA